MKSELSISRAWDESKARIAADGRLFIAVALALVGLPTAVAQFVRPNSGFAAAPESPAESVLMILVLIIGLIGQLALVRLALGPSVSVGEAIGHGARRMPPYLGAAALLLLGLFLLTLPFGAAIAAMGVSLEPGTAPPASASLVVLVFLAVLLFLGTRMLLSSAVASAEKAGPIAIIRRSWRLTAGHSLRLLGFVLLFLVGALIAVGAITFVTKGAVTLLFGPVEPLSLSALLVGLVNALMSSLATMLFVVMIARIYAQLSGEGATEVSVPSSGT